MYIRVFAQVQTKDGLLCTDGWVVGWVGGWLDGLMDGWME